MSTTDNQLSRLTTSCSRRRCRATAELERYAAGMDALQEAVRELGAAYDDYFALSNVLRRDSNRVLGDQSTDQPWRRTSCGRPGQ
jgi:hypothetical protein